MYDLYNLNSDVEYCNTQKSIVISLGLTYSQILLLAYHNMNFYNFSVLPIFFLCLNKEAEIGKTG